MKCLSLWEPWASLMALGHKTIETRSWPTYYRGLLAIQASKRWTRDQRDFASASGVRAVMGDDFDYSATLGHVVCIVNLYDVQPTEYIEQVGGIPALGYNTRENLDFGNFDHGRFGWMTKGLRRLKRPIPIIGLQGLFDVNLIWCDGCDGIGLMEGWNRRDGHPCPKCWGDCVVLPSPSDSKEQK